MQRVLLYLKGVCMGVADIIPGVSGGTLALILGIYTELVNTIRGLNLAWVAPLWRWLSGGRKDEDRRELIRALERLNLPFLMVLGAGIATAIVVGGLILPGLLERYPEVMRALFFGLILASVPVPFKMIEFRSGAMRAVAAVAVVVGVAVGWVLTNPSTTVEAGLTWKEMESQEQTMRDVVREGPSAWAAEQVYWAPQNEALRLAMDSAYPELELEPPQPGAARDKDAIKARSEVYEELTIPAGTPVQVPQPAPWYIFVVGMIAICAMILPGISGSYLLLILGGYFFVLNALKGVITGLASGSLPLSAGLYVGLFMAGAAIGILSFARVLSWLLERWPVPTLGVLVGLMVGCLRGIWPFQGMEEGSVINVLPPAFDATVVASLGAAIVGAVLVTVLGRIGSAHQAEKGA
ncbi:hypothetical protein DL240_12315 [Lujinxingia litoralis]|uniref:DUF368 domain-containing protein n=1 Tax=Lujinxingia litoralis TaxID=2211119 RepID=A0A328C4W6_9DELT|nr:DUF368 domain-containing protein [Lujinxingia litoralis]RAL21635.1 hypothetical protein DL240_12315 [Lujinxingia litoralis]